MLEVRHLSAGYGRTDVLRGISIAVPEGTVIGLLGANGAGKSTLALSISGLTRISSGDATFEGVSLRGRTPEQIVELGLVQVPQGRLLFRDLTVEENLRVGAYPRRARGSFEANIRQVHEHFPVLADRRNQLAGLLSGGEQQMLAIGRALMACPRLLILDEPSLGLAPRVIRQIFATVRDLNRSGMTILVAEQNARQVLATASYAYVLEGGRVQASGSSEELMKDSALQEAYLGIPTISKVVQ